MDYPESALSVLLSPVLANLVNRGSTVVLPLPHLRNAFEFKHLETEEHLCRLNLLTPMGDQERISPCNINTSDESKEICESWDCWLIQYQIKHTKNIRMAWQTVIKITNKTLGMKGLDN